MRIAIGVVSAAFIVVSGEALAEAPWPNEYVLSNEIRSFPTPPSDGEWLPNHLVVETRRKMINLSSRKTRAEYRTMMREDPSSLSVSNHQVLGLARIIGWEDHDHPCELEIEARDLDGGLVTDQSNNFRFLGTPCIEGNVKSTPTLEEDEFITGVRICQSRKAYDNYRLKGIELQVARLGADGLEEKRNILGYKRLNCPRNRDGWQEEYYQCGRNEIVVGLDILWSQEETRDPPDIHLLLPVCAPVISKNDLTPPTMTPAPAPGKIPGVN